MKRQKHYAVAARSIGTLAALLLLVTGVTFAALTSQDAALTGNTITSATANLQIAGADNVFGASAPGFSFTNVEPGGAWAPAAGNILSLRNGGTTALTLRLKLRAANLSNPNNVNLTKVSLGIMPTGGTRQVFTLAALQSADQSGSSVALNITIPANQDLQLNLQAQLSADAVAGTTSGIALSNIDLVFSGTSVSA